MPESLTESVHAAVDDMTWLKPSDRAAVDLAFTYAAQIDAVLETGDAQQIVKALYLGPHLLNTLRALGGTPLSARCSPGSTTTWRPASSRSCARHTGRGRALVDIDRRRGRPSRWSGLNASRSGAASRARIATKTEERHGITSGSCFGFRGSSMTDVDDREVYPNAPVVLVALEVRHPATESLSQADRRTIKRQLAADLPVMRSGTLTQITSAVTPVGGAAAPPEVRVEEFPRYFSRDNTTAVSFRAESIVVETTRYVRWEHLRKLVSNVLEARQSLGDLDGVERVGLRYIDEIRVPGGANWRAWVDGTLLGPTSVAHELGLVPGQWQGVSLFSPGEERTVVLRYGPQEGYAVDPGGDLKRSKPVPIPGPFFLMDIDSFWTPNGRTPEFETKGLLERCDELHTPVRGLFERLITERLRTEVLRHAD